MKKRRLATIAALATAALSMGAAPAFTQSTPTGTVSVSVAVAPPAAPCLTVDPGAIDFGTLPLHPSSAPALGQVRGINLRNCGTAAETINVSGTSASGPSGTWELDSRAIGAGGMCARGVNKYALVVAGAPVNGEDRIQTDVHPFQVTLGGGFGPHVFQPATDATPLRMVLLMPCQGSNGEGETKTMSVTFTAVVV